MTQTYKRRPPATPRQAARRASPLDAHLDPELFHALADPTRLALVRCIAQCARGCSVSEIAQCCAVDLSVVSRHLALLARAGILDSQRRGRTTLYRVRYAQLSATLRALADALDDCQPDPRIKPNGDFCHDGCC